MSFGSWLRARIPPLWVLFALAVCLQTGVLGSLLIWANPALRSRTAILELSALLSYVATLQNLAFLGVAWAAWWPARRLFALESSRRFAWIGAVLLCLHVMWALYRRMAVAQTWVLEPRFASRHTLEQWVLQAAIAACLLLALLFSRRPWRRLGWGVVALALVAFSLGRNAAVESRERRLPLEGLSARLPGGGGVGQLPRHRAERLRAHDDDQSAPTRDARQRRGLG